MLYWTKHADRPNESWSNLLVQQTSDHIANRLAFKWLILHLISSLPVKRWASTNTSIVIPFHCVSKFVFAHVEYLVLLQERTYVTLLLIVVHVVLNFTLQEVSNNETKIKVYYKKCFLLLYQFACVLMLTVNMLRSLVNWQKRTMLKFCSTTFHVTLIIRVD